MSNCIFGTTPVVATSVIADSVDTGEIDNSSGTYIDVKDRILLPDGKVSAPSYSFESYPSSGLYVNTNGTLITSIAGVNKLAISDTSFSILTDIGAGTNQLSCGAVACGAITAGGTISSGAILSSGTISCGTNSLTCGSVSSRAISTGTYSTTTSSVITGTGSSVAPTVCFASDSTSGFFGSASGISAALGGITKFTIGATAANSGLLWTGGSGSAAAPGLSYNEDTSSGIFLKSLYNLGISTQGTERLSVGTSTITSTIPCLSLSAAASAPAYSFSSSTSSGLYSSATGVVDVSAAGTQALTVASTYVKSPVQPYIQLSPTVNTPQSLTSGAETTLTYWTVEESRTGFAAASGGTITAPVAGIYHISATVSFANNTTGNRMANICIGGV